MLFSYINFFLDDFPRLCKVFLTSVKFFISSDLHIKISLQNWNHITHELADLFMGLFDLAERREIITRGQSYSSRIPQYWPPIPLSAGRMCTPRLCCGGRTNSPGGEGDGGSIFWKTRKIGLAFCNDLSTLPSIQNMIQMSSSLLKSRITHCKWPKRFYTP